MSNSLYLKQGTLPLLQKLSGVLGKKLIFVDLETTGFVNAYNFAIIEVGIVIITEKGIIEESSLLSPGFSIPRKITELTGITNDMVKGKPDFTRYVKFFSDVAREGILLGFNSKSFDSKGIEKVAKSHGYDFVFNNQLDVRYIFNRERNETTGTSGSSGKLLEAKRHYKISLDGDAHRAGYDIALTAIVLEVILQKQGLDYILKEVEKMSCQKTIQKYRNNFTEYCTTTKKYAQDSSLKSNVVTTKLKTATVKNTKPANKVTPKKNDNMNEFYRKKYLEEKKQGSGIIGKVLGNLFK